MSLISWPWIVAGMRIWRSAPVSTPILATSMKKMIRHMTMSISGVTLGWATWLSGIPRLRMVGPPRAGLDARRSLGRRHRRRGGARRGGRRGPGFGRLDHEQQLFGDQRAAH